MEAVKSIPKKMLNAFVGRSETTNKGYNLGSFLFAAVGDTLEASLGTAYLDCIKDSSDFMSGTGRHSCVCEHGPRSRCYAYIIIF